MITDSTGREIVINEQSLAYLTARDYIINLSKEDQAKLYQFMHDAYDHCRIYK